MIPEVVQTFARIVNNCENLDTLLVMTMADSKVGGNSWTGHKELLLRELYCNTVRHRLHLWTSWRVMVPLDSQQR